MFCVEKKHLIETVLLRTNNVFLLKIRKNDLIYNTVKPVLSGQPKRTPKLAFKTDYRLMQIKKHSAILSTFINLPFVIKICVLSIFEWPF